MSELKPCPFCGGEAETIRFGYQKQSHIIECSDCGCRPESNENWNHGNKWNRRAELSREQVVPDGFRVRKDYEGKISVFDDRNLASAEVLNRGSAALYRFFDAMLQRLTAPAPAPAPAPATDEQSQPAQVVPEWLPIETAPANVAVLIYYKNELGKSRIIKAVLVEQYTIESNSEDYEDGCTEYDEKTDRYTLIAGWYEQIDNWEDYTQVLIEPKPTSWMPLPPPPTGIEG